VCNKNTEQVISCNFIKDIFTELLALKILLAMIEFYIININIIGRIYWSFNFFNF